VVALTCACGLIYYWLKDHDERIYLQGYNKAKSELIPNREKMTNAEFKRMWESLG